MAKSERSPSSHPGIAKVRAAPILRRRRAELITTIGGRVLELFEAASVVSEGSARTEESGRIYYGTTSLLFAFQSDGGILPREAAADLALALEHDPHARLQLLRIAHREAWARASAPLGPVSAEFRVTVTARGVVVSIDVEAAVMVKRATSNLL